MMLPLPLPDTPSGVARPKLEIQRIDYAAPETSGRQGGVTAGWPLWLGSWELDPVDRLSADLWEAFNERLRGRQRRFLGGDTSRPYPIAYPGGFAGMTRAGGGAFAGAVSTWSQTVNADGDAAIALTGLPPNFTLSIGDWIGWKWDGSGEAAGSYGRRTLAKVVIGGTGSGGGALTVTAEPPIDPRVVPVGAIVHLDKPQAVFVKVPEKTNLAPRRTGGGIGGGVFTALQDLRP